MGFFLLLEILTLFKKPYDSFLIPHLEMIIDEDSETLHIHDFIFSSIWHIFLMFF